MKHLFFSFIFTLFCITNLLSQNLEHAVIIVFNYENGIYRGVFENEVVSSEGDWYIDRPRYERRFLNEFNKIIGKSRTPKMGIVCTPEYLTELGDVSAVPIVKIEILTVDDKGNLTANVIIENTKDSEKFLSPKLFKCSGGVFGTWLNLFGDGMEALGSAVGNYVRKAL